MSEIITKLIGVAAILGIAIAVVALVSLIGSFILWLIYTYVVATTFGLPAIAFWKFWLISIFVSAVGRALFGRSSVNSKSK